MSQLIESIRFEDGKYHLLDLHQDRVNRSFAACYPGQKPIELTDILPSINESGKFKIRVVYDHRAHKVEHARYQPKNIRSVKLVEANDLEYAFKYSDRNEINKLVEDSGADEIIIVKNGFITDASYANIACFDGDGWWTPERPLLNGTKRTDLLNKGILRTRNIRPHELSSFQKICLINAMLDLEEVILPI